MDAVRTELERLVRRVTGRDPGEGNGALLAAGLLDSLQVVQLAGLIEETFEIRFEPWDFVPEHFESIEALARFVRARRRPGAEVA